MPIERAGWGWYSVCWWALSVAACLEEEILRTDWLLVSFMSMNL